MFWLWGQVGERALVAGRLGLGEGMAALSRGARVQGALNGTGSLEIFGPLQRHLLCHKGRVMRRFDPELTALQRRLLSLLGLSPKAFLHT